MKKVTIIKILDKTIFSPLMFDNLLTTPTGKALLAKNVEIIDSEEEQKLIIREKRDVGFIGLNLTLLILNIAFCYLCVLGYRVEVELMSYGYNFDKLFCIICSVLFAVLALINLVLLVREAIYILNNQYIFDKKNQKIVYPSGVFSNKIEDFSDCAPTLIKNEYLVKFRVGASYRLIFHKTKCFRFELRFWSQEVAMEFWSTIVRYMEGYKMK